MALNEIHANSDTLKWRVAPGIVAGDPVVFASGKVGVAETDAVANTTATAPGGDTNSYATLRHRGVYVFPFTGALNAGTAIYVSSTPVASVGVKGTLTATSTANTLFGTVFQEKASGAGNLYILIGGN